MCKVNYFNSLTHVLFRSDLLYKSQVYNIQKLVDYKTTFPAWYSKYACYKH